MDPEQSSVDPLLAPTPENLASVKVFPLIPALKKDVTVSLLFPTPEHKCAPTETSFLVLRKQLVSAYNCLRGVCLPKLSIADSALSWE